MFAHPASNSLPRSLLGELSSTISALSAQEDLRVIIIESAGESAFCAGASFDELLQIKTVPEGEAFFSGFAEVILALNKAPQITISRVQGKVAGGGIGIACATDFTFALGSAAARLSELAIGIGPFTVGPVVQRRIGNAAFAELALSAEWRDSAWAAQHGLFTEVFADSAELETRLLAFANKIAAYPSSATAAVKRMIGETFDAGLASQLQQRVTMVSQLVIAPEAQALIQAARRK